MSERVPAALVACLLIALAGCGSDNEQSRPEGYTAPTVYWSGKPGDFCEKRLAAEAGERRAAAGLLLQRRRVSPGDTLPVRIRNSGREALTHGVGAIAQQLVRGRWEPRSLAERGKPTLVPAVAVIVSEGATGNCHPVSIPTHWSPGRYRVTFELELFDPDGENVVMRPWGNFQVAAGPGGQR